MKEKSGKKYNKNSGNRQYLFNNHMASGIWVKVLALFLTALFLMPTLIVSGESEQNETEGNDEILGPSVRGTRVSNLEITNPNNEEEFEGGKVINIAWRYTEKDGYFRIFYSKDGGQSYPFCIASENMTYFVYVNEKFTFLHQWTVPMISNCHTMKIRVEYLASYNDSSLIDSGESEGNFIIINPNQAEIKFTSVPAEIIPGETYYISWNLTDPLNLTDRISLYIRFKDNKTWTELYSLGEKYENIPPSTTSIKWKAPYFFNQTKSKARGISGRGTGGPDEVSDEEKEAKILIELTRRELPGIEDPVVVSKSESETTFKNSYIILKTPNGGEELVGGETYNITWRTSKGPDYVALYYTTDYDGDEVLDPATKKYVIYDRSNYLLITNVEPTENDWNFEWTVPEDIDSENVRIKVECPPPTFFQPQTYSDVSDGDITIIPSPFGKQQMVSLLTPDPWNENFLVLNVDQNYPITWRAFPFLLSHYNLYLSLNGSSYEPLVGAQNLKTTTFNWDVYLEIPGETPSFTGDWAEAKIKVECVFHDLSKATDENFYTFIIQDSGNRWPITDAPMKIDIDEREPVTLDGTNSTDPDDDELAYSWTQVDNTGFNLLEGIIGTHDEKLIFDDGDIKIFDYPVDLLFELEVDDIETEDDRGFYPTGYFLDEIDRVCVHVNPAPPVITDITPKNCFERVPITITGTDLANASIFIEKVNGERSGKIAQIPLDFTCDEEYIFEFPSLSSDHFDPAEVQIIVRNEKMREEYKFEEVLHVFPYPWYCMDHGFAFNNFPDSGDHYKTYPFEYGIEGNFADTFGMSDVYLFLTPENIRKAFEDIIVELDSVRDFIDTYLADIKDELGRIVESLFEAFNVARNTIAGAISGALSIFDADWVEYFQNVVFDILDFIKIASEDTIRFIFEAMGWIIDELGNMVDIFLDILHEFFIFIRDFPGLPDPFDLLLYYAGYKDIGENGHCYGMSATSLQFYHGLRRFDHFGDDVDDIDDFNRPLPSNRWDGSNTLTIDRVISCMQGSQLSGQLLLDEDGVWQFTSPLEEIIDNIIDVCPSDTPGEGMKPDLGIISMIFVNEEDIGDIEGHAVVPYLIDGEIDDGYLRVYVYDPNYYQFSTMGRAVENLGKTIEKDNTPHYIEFEEGEDGWEWSYRFFPFWGDYSAEHGLFFWSIEKAVLPAQPPQRRDFDPVTSIDDDISNIITELESWNFFGGSASCTLEDEEGNKLGWNEKGEFKEDIPNATFMPFLGANETDSTMNGYFVYPYGDYRFHITGYEDGYYNLTRFIEGRPAFVLNAETHLGSTDVIGGHGCGQRCKELVYSEQRLWEGLCKISLETSDISKSYSLKRVMEMPGNEKRTYSIIDATMFGDSISKTYLTEDYDSLILVNDGPHSYSFEVEFQTTKILPSYWLSMEGNLTTWPTISTTVTIDPYETLMIGPSNWSNLHESQISVFSNKSTLMITEPTFEDQLSGLEFEVNETIRLSGISTYLPEGTRVIATLGDETVYGFINANGTWSLEINVPDTEGGYILTVSASGLVVQIDCTLHAWVPPELPELIVTPIDDPMEIPGGGKIPILIRTRYMLKGTEVALRLDGSTETGTIDEDGLFTGLIRAPSEKGNYKLTVTAGNITQSIDINVISSVAVDPEDIVQQEDTIYGKATKNEANLYSVVFILIFVIIILMLFIFSRSRKEVSTKGKEESEEEEDEKQELDEDLAEDDEEEYDEEEEASEEVLEDEEVSDEDVEEPFDEEISEAEISDEDLEDDWEDDDILEENASKDKRKKSEKGKIPNKRRR